MKVENIHERKVPRTVQEVGRVLDTLATPDDKLWPFERWPPMKFDRPLAVGAQGGHGPIRYSVESYQPGISIRFTFAGPNGFGGYHGYEIDKEPAGATVLRHVLRMQATGTAQFTWPVIFRWLHDALIEDSLDKAERSLGLAPRGARWSIWVRVLRWMFRRVQARSRSGGRRT